MIMLTIVLRLNALSCLLFGSLFALQPGLVSTFLADTQPAPDWVILLTGLGLVANACYLLLVSRQQQPNRTTILQFAWGDFVWVAVTAILVLSGYWVNSAAGMVAALLVALMVGSFGVLQWRLATPLSKG